jgi:hypothetical protein
MTSAPFSIADLNAIAEQASFQSVIDVARRFGRSAVGGGSSSALTDLLDDPKNDLERVAVDAYPAIMGIGDRESAPTPVDAARALARLDAQNRAEAFRQFRRAMVDHARSVLDSNRLSDRMLSAFLREAVQRWDDTPR